MDLRRALILGAVPAGLALGSAAWLVAPSHGVAESVTRLDERILSVPVRKPMTLDRGEAGVLSAAIPLFALTTGPGAITEAVIKLEGVAKSPVRAAALVSINGAPADWLQVGDSRDGVTLQSVTPGEADFDTPTGTKSLAVGESTGAPGPQGDSTIPPGFHQPPPPASAPSKP